MANTSAAWGTTRAKQPKDLTLANKRIKVYLNALTGKNDKMLQVLFQRLKTKLEEAKVMSPQGLDGFMRQLEKKLTGDFASSFSVEEMAALDTYIWPLRKAFREGDEDIFGTRKTENDDAVPKFCTVGSVTVGKRLKMQLAKLSNTRTPAQILLSFAKHALANEDAAQVVLEGNAPLGLLVMKDIFQALETAGHRPLPLKEFLRGV